MLLTLFDKVIIKECVSLRKIRDCDGRCWFNLMMFMGVGFDQAGAMA
jgi:hypothetical protein